MVSIRKVKKTRWMSVKPMIKEIKSYGHKFSYKYGGGYFIFSFSPDEYNLHITFDKLPNMKFGIWKTTKYGDKKMYFFAENTSFIDKFKPSYSSFGWDTLDEMMTFVHDSITHYDYYKTQMLYAYNSYKTWEEFEEYEKNDKFRRSHNYFSDRNEYYECLNKFNTIIKNIDINKFDIFWRLSDGYHDLYDVWYYCDPSVTDEEEDNLLESIIRCRCFVFGSRRLPKSFWSKKNKYQMKIHPENKKLYSSCTKYLSYFGFDKYSN